MPAHVTFADENPNSIVNCIGNALANARTLRHQVATEMWEVLNRFHLDVQRPARRRRATAGPEHVALFCRSVVEFSQLYQGVTDSTMPREEGWYFLQAGKFLERAEKTARALDVNYRLLVGDAATGDRRGPRRRRRRPAALGQRAALPLGLRVVLPRLVERRAAPRGVLELLLALAGRAALDPLLGGEGGRRAAAHHRGGARLQRLASARAQRGDAGEARRAIGRLHGELAYQRFDDIVDSGLHALPRRPAAALLPHRRARGGGVLRAPAADRAGGAWREVPHPPPHDLRLRAPGVRELQRDPAAADGLRRRRRCSTSTSRSSRRRP